MSLISVNQFDHYCAIIKEIEESEGDVSEKTSEELIEVKRSIASSIDSTVRYRKYLKDSVDKYKDALRHFVGVQEKKLARLDDFLKWTLEFTGDLRTPFASIKIQTRKTKKVIIEDFDLVQKFHPECVTISTFDNVRTIRLSKDDLIKIATKNEPMGYQVIESETKFIDAREKTKKGEKNDITENQDN
jgi:hypothetical protein